MTTFVEALIIFFAGLNLGVIIKAWELYLTDKINDRRAKKREERNVLRTEE